MIAASAGRDVIVSLLIDSGADVNSTNEGGQTSLHYAASRNRYEVAVNCKHIQILCLLHVRYLFGTESNRKYLVRLQSCCFTMEHMLTHRTRQVLQPLSIVLHLGKVNTLL